ncbi:AmmeMemoRadiSam system protein A [Desulfatitalea alkaliphila]|uniref:AmmeMemoRadiSam system protein A n=1 Tax=Desulfatitalea alkaliphila TaxID=2929485 RepID=A0AA41R5X5_9BACT|nr:AmmeMemoRadiSam system protein A [Desulfatitalea alkaliphila]MCJ8502053.1 AmmeMemoRadiSam system protein A [Desulfatitalea alkaliphila]
MDGEHPPQLSEALGRRLVALARHTLCRRLGRTAADDQAAAQSETELSDPALAVPGGVFVTLKKAGCLRGCIGTLEGRDPLTVAVPVYAEHAAFRDPRFDPLTADELAQVDIEVSVLTPPRPLPYKDGDDLAAKLRPGVDGVILRKGAAGATFLPQVWEQLPRPADFLSQLCLKAGLPADAWRSERLAVETYQVQSFAEDH